MDTKTLIIALVIALSAIAAYVLINKSAEHSTPIDLISNEYTSTYVCTKHCEGSGSEIPCKCPSCGNNQVLAKSLNYTCPMHKEMTGKEGQKCRKCNTALKKVKRVELVN